jgi:hypothetical protein
VNAKLTGPTTIGTTSDWYGRWRPRTAEENDYLIDREAQRTRSFSGIPGIAAED